MDLKEAARRLNISEITARRWIKSGRLRARIIEGPYGPQYEIDNEAIEEARNNSKAPVILNDSTLSAGTLIKEIREAVKEEIKGEISIEFEEIKKQIAETEERLSSWQEERDRKLMQAIREIQQRQEEMSKPFWKRWFK